MNLRILLVVWLLPLTFIGVQAGTLQVESDTTDNGYSPAVFPGGLDSLYKHLEDNFRLSRVDNPFALHEELVADVRLTINRKGEVIHMTSGGSWVEYELERAFRSLPPFEPATLDGEPVNSYMELRFMFLIQGNRLRVIDHIHDVSTSRTRESGWFKATLVGAAVLIFLLLWGL